MRIVESFYNAYHLVEKHKIEIKESEIEKGKKNIRTFTNV